MSVSASDRAKYDEKLTRTRDDYEAKETETIRRKNNEIKNAERRHQEEIKKLTNEFQEKVGELQSRNRELLSDRDVSHQKDVESLKAMYKDQMRSKSEQAALEKRVVVDTYSGQINKQKEINESQRKNLTSKQEQELLVRDEKLKDIMVRSRESMHDSIDDNRRKMNEAHEKERQNLVKNREESLSRKELESGEVKKALNAEINSQKRSRDLSDRKWEQKYYDTIRNHGDLDNSNLQTRSELMKAESKTIQNRYDKALKQKTEALDENNEQFRENVNDRINSQVRSRDSQIQLLKGKLTNEQVKGERMRDLEKKHLTSSYEAQMADLGREREEYIDHMNDLVHTRVEGLRDKNDTVVREANKNYRSQMALINTTNREERKNLKEQQDSQLQHVKSSAESRVEKIQRITNQNTNQLSRNFDESVDILKDGYSAKVAAQRDKQLTEQARLSQILTKRVRNLEETYQTRLDALQGEYETNLVQLREDQKKEIRRIEGNFKNLVQDRERGHKSEKESIEQKYEAKIAAIEEQHQKDKELQHKRHDEDLKNLSQRLTNYSRKA